MPTNQLTAPTVVMDEFNLDGPAVEWADGTKEWWVDDKLHRLDGPAIENADGTKRWFIDDVELTEAEFEAQRTSQA